MCLLVVFADKKPLKHSIFQSNSRFRCNVYGYVYICINVVPYHFQDLIGNEIVFLINSKSDRNFLATFFNQRVLFTANMNSCKTNHRK